MDKLCELEADNAADKELATELWRRANELRAAAEAYRTAGDGYYAKPGDAVLRAALDSKASELAVAVCLGARGQGVGEFG